MPKSVRVILNVAIITVSRFNTSKIFKKAFPIFDLSAKIRSVQPIQSVGNFFGRSGFYLAKQFAIRRFHGKFISEAAKSITHSLISIELNFIDFQFITMKKCPKCNQT
ncbi:MAG: hypothetical protein LH472_06300, partial [Pyrinomonadaceae bacterium]|nr:hypothetical protein [Pyrinomonadaceae bacterium]